MDPLSGIIGLAGIASQSSHQNLQTALQWMNLQWQKEQARRQERFSMATRSDAYGNQQKYDELMNEWKQILTPTQNQILKAGEKEQLLSLTEDATRNRDIKRAQADRGKEAGKDYNRALAGYRFDQPKGEASIRDNLNAIMGSGEEAGQKGQQAASIRQALRSGRGALLPNIVKSADDSVGQGLADRLLKARQQGVQEAATRLQAHDARYIPELQTFSQLMDAGGGAPIKYSDLPQAMAGQQSEQARAIQAALQATASNVGGAYNALAAAAGKSPDFGAAARGFGSPASRTKSYNLVNSGSSVGTSVNDPSERDRIDLQGNGSW